MLLKQESNDQHLAELMNGHQISESNENDLYTMLVPVEETILMPDPDSKSGDVKFKYVLSERDYFDSAQLFEGDQTAMNKANQLTMKPPNLFNPGEIHQVSITCSFCSTVEEAMPLWYKCDPNSKENEPFAIKDGRASAGHTFQFSKA